MLDAQASGARSVALIEGAGLQLRDYEQRARELEAEAIELKRNAVKILSDLEELAVSAEEVADNTERAARDAIEMLKTIAAAVERELAPRSAAEVAPAVARRAA